MTEVLPIAVLCGRGPVERLTAWFGDRWNHRAAATFNRHLDALRSAMSFWIDQGWLSTDPTRRLRRRGHAPGRTRALSTTDIDALLDLEAPLFAITQDTVIAYVADWPGPVTRNPDLDEPPAPATNDALPAPTPLIPALGISAGQGYPLVFRRILLGSPVPADRWGNSPSARMVNV
ncbi:hypothetical protein [Actinomadura formosensis]|uniref:hypothetical protein n=1 Tax=Actinomadura formosensis TaxID=60706 RepID=UPI003D913894